MTTNEANMEKEEKKCQSDDETCKQFEEIRESDQLMEQQTEELINCNSDDEPADILDLKTRAVGKYEEFVALRKQYLRWVTQVNSSRPLNKLHPNIEWEILKQLDFKDYCNLALTCKKWYNTAVSAPNYVKPNLHFKLAHLNHPGIQFGGKTYFRRIPSVRLINKIKCDSLWIKNHLDHFRFIYKNRSHFEFDCFDTVMPVYSEEIFLMVRELAKMATKLSIHSSMRDNEKKTQACVFDEKHLMETPFKNTSNIVCWDSTASVANVILKYSSDTPTTSTATKSSSKSSMLRKLASTLSVSLLGKKEPIKVRLINDWSDVTMHRLNIIVCNFLYDKQNGNLIWAEVERATSLRREHIFYGVVCFSLFLLIISSPVNFVLVLVTIAIPACGTLLAMQEPPKENSNFWMQYWVVYGVVHLIECLILRIFPNANFAVIKLALLGSALVPWCTIVQSLFNIINGRFDIVRTSFEKYNYQAVA